jgi:energy-coupling factor transport system permease protein
MFKDITIGQYVDGNSAIHKMDPRVKILLSIVYIVILFMIYSIRAYLLFGIFTLALVLISGVPFKYIIKGLKPILYILIFTAVINLFMTGGSTVIWRSALWSSLKITKEGVSAAVQMVLRLVFLVTGTSLLTLTTTPIMLTDGIEKLLKPFEIIKVPSHEIAMMMTIAIRFIPTLSEETEKIMKAQMARGADFESGNIFRRTKAMVPILVPLFISAFRRADDLAIAMDSRCYNSGNKRTRMKVMKMTWIDAVATAVMLVFCTAVIVVQKF